MLVYALVWLFLGMLIGWMGKNRKFGFWGYMLLSLVLSPLVGLLLVLASDTRKPKV